MARGRATAMSVCSSCRRVVVSLSVVVWLSGVAVFFFGRSSDGIARCLRMVASGKQVAAQLGTSGMLCSATQHRAAAGGGGGGDVCEGNKVSGRSWNENPRRQSQRMC